MPTRSDEPGGSAASPVDVAEGDGDADGAAARVVRRAPFSTNPEVGVRGQRTQQRILEAALQLFGEEGYHRCSIDRITDRAGCSRASFYQYFSGKEAVFQQLSGQVARQLSASTEALDLLTPDEAGWVALRAWIARHAEIYRRYEPAFHEYETAASADESVASGSARWRQRNIARVHARIVTTTLPPRQLDPVITILATGITRSFAMASILRSAAPDDYPEEPIVDALTDVVHRSLFGFDPDVNVHPPTTRRPHELPFDGVVRDAFRYDPDVDEPTDGNRETLQALLRAGHDAFLQLGYHRVRVDDVVEAAGVSHGAFYRYFDNKDELALELTAAAMRDIATVFAELPADEAYAGAAGRTALRRWLRRYNRAQSDEAAMLQVWVEASVQDATTRSTSAPALWWGRQMTAAFLRRRDFGDVETEALVLLAVLGAFGSRPHAPAGVDTAAHIVQQGFLGL